MFEDFDLISRKESKKIFKKQENLVSEFEKNNSENILLQISLLHTLVPICDVSAAINILNSFPCKEFNTLIIGAYLCAECLESDNNSYLDKLFSRYECFNPFEKSIIKYVQALYVQNHNLMTENEVFNIITESISLCNEYVSNFYLRYLTAHNNSDLIKAKQNLKTVLNNEEINSMTIDEFIKPEQFIEEKILMNVIPDEVNKAIFDFDK